MQPDLIEQIAESLIYNAPELAVWCWALLQTLHPKPSPHAGRIRLAMILLLLTLFATPFLYAVAIEIFGRGPDPDQVRRAINVVRLLLGLIHAWCWYVVLKAAFENRQQRGSPAAAPYQFPDTSGR